MDRFAAGGAGLTIVINGVQVEGLIHASIMTTNCFSADSFALTLAIGRPPLGDIDFWAATSVAYVEVFAAAQSDRMSQILITGMADSVLIDPILGTIAIEGRDLSSSMIDSYRQQDFVNQTASEIVAAIARYHGLGAAVEPTAGSVGRYYGDGYTRLSLGRFSRLRSDWDLVVQLARENSFDVYVLGTTLFFQPSAGASDAPVPLAVGDVQRVRIERRLSITASTTARVQSWNSQNMATYDSGKPIDSAGSKSAPSTPGNQVFLFSSSNLTLQQVTDAASRYTAELARLKKTLHIDMPWDFTLNPRTTVLLYGTHSDLDSTYRIDSIDRHYNSKSGSSQSIRAAAI